MLWLIRMCGARTYIQKTTVDTCDILRECRGYACRCIRHVSFIFVGYTRKNRERLMIRVTYHVNFKCMYVYTPWHIHMWVVCIYIQGETDDTRDIMTCVTYHVKHTIESYHTHQHVDAFIHLPHSHQQDWLVGINHSVIYDWETYSLMHVSIWMRHMGSDPLDMSICSRYENIDAFVCESIWMRHTLMRVSMTESTDNAASPTSTRSSNSHFAVSPGTKTNSHEPGIDLNVYRGIQVCRSGGF